MPRTPGSGRKAGTPNKATAEIKEAARAEGPGVIKLFTALYKNPRKPDAVRMAAGRELLDRGYGKPCQQPAGSDPDEPITVILKQFVLNEDEPAQDPAAHRPY